MQPTYAKIISFSDNILAPVQAYGEDGRWGYINEAGSEVIEPKFDKAGSFFADGYAIVQVEGKFGVIDTAGQFVLEPVYVALDAQKKNHSIPEE